MSFATHHRPAAALALALAAGAAAEPVITDLNHTSYTRSQRVAITGTGFGTSGQVMIAGLEAWTATWNDTRIVAYVPEAAALGARSLHVVAGGEASNDVPLTLTLREPDGRVRWRFETDGDDQWWRPAVAPDGTLYLHTNNEHDGLVYALAPDGALKWIRKVNWYPYAPPTAGPDGAVYGGSIDTAYRISSSGQLDWTIGGQEVGCSPTCGPDGMLYGAFEVQPGAFAVDPGTGQYDWTNDPGLSNWGQPGNEIRFGQSRPGAPIDRFYVSWDAIWAFSLDGDHLFTSGAPNVVAHEPAIGADGTIYMPGYNSAWLVAYSPDDGSILWDTNSDWLARISTIEIGPDDTLFFISDGTSVHAFDPHTQSTVWENETGVYLGRPTLSPDGSLLITSGGGSSELGFVKAFETSSGAERWSLDLQEVYNPKFRFVPIHRARFSPDGETAYMPTWTAQWPFHDGDPRTPLFAIATGDVILPVVGDIDGDGSVTFGDLLLLLADWGPCGGTCPSDLDGNGNVSFSDLLILLANWG